MTNKHNVPDFKKLANYATIKSICEDFDKYIFEYYYKYSRTPIDDLLGYIPDMNNINYSTGIYHDGPDKFNFTETYEGPAYTLVYHLANGKMRDYFTKYKDTLDVHFYEFMKALYDKLPDLVDSDSE
jgi:hypothetical protein